MKGAEYIIIMALRLASVVECILISKINNSTIVSLTQVQFYYVGQLFTQNYSSTGHAMSANIYAMLFFYYIYPIGITLNSIHAQAKVWAINYPSVTVS